MCVFLSKCLKVLMSVCDADIENGVLAMLLNDNIVGNNINLLNSSTVR